MHAAGCAKPPLEQVLWLNKVGEPPGHPGHNIGYDHDVVELCPACGGGTLEQLRHDCFDFESVYDQYEWYELTPEDGVRMRAIAARCGQPLNPFCVCAVHTSLKASALALPSSSWDVVYEWDAHRHVVTIDDGAKPGFRLVTRGEPKPKAPAPALAKTEVEKLDAPTALFVFVAWPLLYVGGLVAYFRAVDWPSIVDAIVVIAGALVSFVAAGMIVAAISVMLPRKTPPSS